LLEEGRLTDGQGHTVDFRNTVIIMTSNIGTQYIQRGGQVGFRTGERADVDAAFEERVLAELKRTFRPELLNRIDEIIVFHTLKPEHIHRIVDLQIGYLAERLAAQGMGVELTQPAREWLAQKGYDPQFGARPLKRVIQRHIESPLSKKVLSGEFGAGDTIVIVVEGDELGFVKKEPPTVLETGVELEQPVEA